MPESTSLDETRGDTEPAVPETLNPMTDPRCC
ncbi:hypothetical protein FHS44_002439 [Streptosporangium saharense]|uniref:Uncharacterized protein n=1 Tax=Streptosporangium saharense TaxID=1706840 RepID=A0A7W7QKQ5_9ACTN|nr:hypothetical protein [Streptosporangium saharense]